MEFPKAILDTLLSKYFQNLGIIEENQELDIYEVEVDESSVSVEADIIEGTKN